MLKLKTLAAVLATLAMLAVSLPADARAGSPSGSKSSFTSSRSVTATPARAPVRAGGGASVGLRRSEAMREARSQPAEPARSYSRATEVPATQPTGNGNSIIGSNVPRREGTPLTAGGGSAGGGSAGNYARPATQEAPRRGWSGAQIAGAAALAGVAGYAMADNRDPAPTSTPTQTPQVHEARIRTHEAPEAGGYSERAPRAASAAVNNPPTSQTEKPAPASMLGGLLLALLVVVGAFFLLRSLVKRDRGNQPAGQAGTNKAGSDPALATTPSPRATAAPSADAQSELLREAPELFRRVQDANNRGDLEELAALSDDGDLLQYFVSSINERNEAPRTKVLAVSVRGNRVLDFVSSAASFTGSIHFKAEIAEGDGPSEVIEEVWHFLKPSGGGTWKLAGIEQL